MKNKKLVSFLVSAAVALSAIPAMSVSAASDDAIIIQAEAPSEKHVDLSDTIDANGNPLVHSQRPLAEDGLQYVDTAHTIINFALHDSYTYTFDASAGAYTLSVNNSCDRDAPYTFSVNGGALVTANSTKVAGSSHGVEYVDSVLGEVELVDGSNTITFTISTINKNFNAYTDYYTLTPVTAHNPDDDLPVVGENFKIEGEDFISYTAVDGTTVTQLSAIPKASEEQPSWGTGDGTVKSVFTGQNKAKAGDTVYYTYKVKAETAGIYNMVLSYNVQEWRAGKMRANITVNGTETYVTLTKATAGADFMNDFHEIEVGAVELVEGVNTITIGTKCYGTGYDEDNNTHYSNNGYIIDYSRFEFDKGIVISSDAQTTFSSLDFDDATSVDDTPEWETQPHKFSTWDKSGVSNASVTDATIRPADTASYKITADAWKYDVYLKYTCDRKSTVTMKLGNGDAISADLESTGGWSTYTTAKIGTLESDGKTAYLTLKFTKDIMITDIIFVPEAKTGCSIKEGYLYNDSGEDKFEINAGERGNALLADNQENVQDSFDIYMAEFDSSNRLVNVTKTTVTTPADGKTTGKEVSIFAGTGVTLVKCIVLRGESLKPMCDSLSNK